MSVRPETIQNREQDLRLDDRGGPPPAKRTTVESELHALRARIAEAKTVTPRAKDLHCADCFARGRDAAIRTIEQKE